MEDSYLERIRQGPEYTTQLEEAAKRDSNVLRFIQETNRLITEKPRHLDEAVELFTAP